MNRVYTYCGVNKDATCFEFVSGYFDGHEVLAGPIVKILMIRTTRTTKSSVLSKDILRHIAKHLWSMRSVGECKILLHSPPTKVLTSEQQTEYTIEHHSKLKLEAGKLLTLKPLVYSYHVESNEATHIKSDLLGCEHHDILRLERFTYLIGNSPIEMLKYSMDWRLQFISAAIATARNGDL